MKRLIKKADDNDLAKEEIQKEDVKKDMSTVKTLLGRIDEASNNLKDVYYALFDNLNALYESYPDLYKEIEMTVKLPKNEDALNVVQFDNDLHQILEHFQDEQYLSSYIVPQSEQNEVLDGLNPKDINQELNDNGLEGLPEKK